jgi:hypothetical protein
VQRCAEVVGSYQQFEQYSNARVQARYPGKLEELYVQSEYTSQPCERAVSIGGSSCMQDCVAASGP